MRAPSTLGDPGRRASLWSALVAAVETYIGEITVLFTVNAAWLMGALILLVLWSLAPVVALVMAVVFVLPTAAYQRLGVVAARGESPRWRHVRDELPRRAARKLLLGAGQLVITAMGATSLGIAVRIGGVAGMASALMAVYVLIILATYALALWPILCDPRRDGPVIQQLRLALALVLLHPMQVVGLGLITALAVAASVQLVAFFLFVPSLVMLATAQYAVTVADRIRPLDASPHDP